MSLTVEGAFISLALFIFSYRSPCSEATTIAIQVAVRIEHILVHYYIGS